MAYDPPLTLESLAEKVDYEGLSSAIIDYFGDDVVEEIAAFDPELARDWAEVRPRLMRIQDKL